MFHLQFREELHVFTRFSFGNFWTPSEKMYTDLFIFQNLFIVLHIHFDFHDLYYLVEKLSKV